MKTSLYITALLAGCCLLSGCAEQPTGLPGFNFGGGSRPVDKEPEATIAFRPDIQADLDEQGCSLDNCHGGATLPMPLTPAPSSDDQWTANYQQVLMRTGDAAASPLMDKATGDGGHIAPMDPDGETAVRWRAWIEQGALYQLGGGTGGAGAGGGGQGGDDGGGGAGPPPTGELSWSTDIYPLVVANACLDCHGSSGWQGAYSLASYDSALGFGTDNTPNVVPGDITSKLIEYTSAGHKGMSASAALVIETWIMDWDAQE